MIVTIIGIIVTIVSIVIGILAIDWKKKKKEYTLKIRKKKTTTDLQEIDFNVESGFKYLDHAIPFYQKELLKTEVSNNMLIVPIPDDYKSILSKKDFIYRESTLEAWNKKLETTFAFLGVENCLEVINKTAIVVAKQIKEKIEDGVPRFNGEMFGVEHIQLQRIGEDENSSLKISFYKTDFFTYRVFATIYQEYKSKFVVKGIDDINKYYTPFLGSFGISNYLLVENNNKKYILFGHRGDKVEVDKNKIHFSMNEAFSMKDIDSIENFTKPSFEKCLERGLREELGLSGEVQRKNLEYFGFMSLIMDINKFELGLSSFAKLVIDENFSLQDLKRSYHSGQDSELETDTAELIEIEKLEEYITQNYDNMSICARNVINTVLARLKNGYLD